MPELLSKWFTATLDGKRATNYPWPSYHVEASEGSDTAEVVAVFDEHPDVPPGQKLRVRITRDGVNILLTDPPEVVRRKLSCITGFMFLGQDQKE